MGAACAEQRGELHVTDSPRFRSPESAVRFAFAVEGRAVIDISPFFRDLRGGTVKLESEVTGESSGWDRVAQAAMVIALIQRHLSKDQQAVLIARYSKPATDKMERDKRRYLLRVLQLVRDELSKPKLYYLADVIRAWAGYRRDHDDEWWAKHYRVAESTLYRWKYGRHYRGEHVTGIMDVLQQLEDSCYQALYQPMLDADLIPDIQDSGGIKKLFRPIKK